MIFYKVIQNETVVDAGSNFLKWNNKYHQLFSCDVNQAQFAQSYNEKKIYYDDWLIPTPNGLVQYERATITVIDQAEYDEIVALLDDGEQIPVPAEEPEIAPILTANNVVPEETPMSVSEMRQKILEQQEQIDLLTQQVQQLLNK